MRERLTTLGCALGALLVFLTLFFHGGDLRGPEAAPPTSAEPGDNGLLGARNWLTGAGIRTVSLRERFGSLPGRHDLPASGNLLIVSLPATTAFRPRELAALGEWLRAGNTLLVLAAIADRPDWAAGEDFHGELMDLTGLGYQTVRAPLAGPAPPRGKGPTLSETARAAAALGVRLAKAERTTLAANRPHAYLEGVREAVALSDYPWRLLSWEAWTVTLPRFGFLLCLAHQRETGEGVLWVLPRGAGSIIVSGFGSLFSNRALALADNARLLANIVAASLGTGGAVLFDDEHQGLSDAYDPARFYRDPRLYGTIAVIAAVWLTWVLGGTRLRIPLTRVPAPREAQLVRVTGAFLARALTPAAGARRMLERFFRRLCARERRAADAGPPWDLIEHNPRVARADLEQLRDWYTAAYSSQRVPLIRLHNLLVRIEGQLEL
jgi:hypothetical protein